ncbi:YfiT family bacillithiol transferase [Alkalihalobacillus sp. FSL W8-0930]
MDLRYPIGPFVEPTVIHSEQISNWIKEMERTPANVRKAVEGLSDAQLDTPYRPGGWTLRQVVHHIPDSHMNSYIRFKWALTEEEPTIRPYFEDRWSELSDSKLAIEVSLNLLDSLHERWTKLLHFLDSAALDRTFIHPENGEVKLSAAIGMYAWHGNHHIAHINSLRERMGW